MGKKRIKHLGKKKRRKKNIYVKSKIRGVGITILLVISIISIFNISKYIEELYVGKDIESNKVQYYIEVADEASEYKMQLNWKELMAIDMVRYDDLTAVKKKDTLKIGDMFISKEKNNDGIVTYKVKSFNEVLDKMGFNKNENNDAKKNVKLLESAYLDSSITSDNSKISFINSIKKVAIESYKKYRILPSITVGQAILESGWGQSELSLKSNNMFGIKADNRWNGKSIEVVTSENYNDKIVASFRSYDSIGDSIKDHAIFLIENKRYKEHGLFEATHYITQAQSLEDAGYSTKTNESGEKIYADTLINVIRSYNLQLIDHEVQVK